MRALRLPFQQRCSYFFEILSYFALSSKCYKLEDLQNNLSQFEKKKKHEEKESSRIIVKNRQPSPWNFASIMLQNHARMSIVSPLISR